MDAISEKLTRNCSQCQIGHQHLKLVTLITWIGDDMITVPDFPAWVCDLCGSRLYDRRAIAQLSLVLNPDVGQPIIQQYVQPSGNLPPNPPPA